MLERLNQRRNVSDGNDVVAKTSLIMRGKIDEVKAPHKFIITRRLPELKHRYTSSGLVLSSDFLCVRKESQGEKITN
jgi:hypothetical protein